MISCETFRASLHAGSSDPAVLGHLRSCDACLDEAVRIDPDNFFRAVGGEELVPPGGVEAFTESVMDQVRLRRTETFVGRRFLVAPRRLAAAAAIVAATAIGALLYDTTAPKPHVAVHPAIAAVTKPAPLVTKPVVETYQSKGATIVEMPTDGAASPNVVMIIDSSLPSDL